MRTGSIVRTEILPTKSGISLVGKIQVQPYNDLAAVGFIPHPCELTTAATPRVKDSGAPPH